MNPKKELTQGIFAIKDIQVDVIVGDHNIFIKDSTNIEITQNIHGLSTEEFIAEIIPKILEHYPNPNSEVDKKLNEFLFASPIKMIGRTTEVYEIMNRLKTNNTLLLVSGVGGIGKTVLANHYYSLFKDVYSHTLWLSGGQDLEEILLNDMTLLVNLGLAEKLLPIIKLIGDPKHKLERDYAIGELTAALKKLPSKTLVIIDNANAKNFKTLQKWQSTFENFHILITSREVNTNLNTFELGVLPLEDALELFYTHYDYEKNDTLVEAILEKIQYHTLLIELIAKAGKEGALPLEILHNFLETGFIEHEGLQFSIDINELKENNRLPDEERIVNYIELLFRTILQLDKDEKEVLSSMSILPFTPHSKELLFKILMNLKKNDLTHFDGVGLLNVLNTLHRKGYLSRERGVYAMHSLVGSATRRHIKLDLISKEPVIENVKKLLNFHPNEGNPVERFPYISLGDSLLKYLPLPSNPANVQAYASLQNELGRVYRVFSNYKKSVELIETAVHLLKQHGSDSNSTKISITNYLTNLSLAYADIGEYITAKDLLEEALDKDYEHFGSVHPGTVSNLATVYKSLGDYEATVKLLNYALERSIYLFGEDSLDTAHAMYNQGLIQKELGKVKEGLEIAQKAVALFEKKLGPQHIKVIEGQIGVNMLYAELGRYTEANLILEKALKNGIALLGENHPTVNNIKNSLAINYGDFGQYDKAINLLEEVLFHQSKLLGPDHPTVSLLQSNLSIYCERNGNYPKALKAAEVALKNTINHFHPNHPAVATQLTNVAVIHNKTGNYQEAIKLLKQALDIDLNQLDENHPKIAGLFSNLGASYLYTGDFQNALAYLLKALNIQAKVLGADHPSIAVTQSNLADTYLSMNDYPKAKYLLELCLKNGIANFGREHPAIPKRLMKLGTVYSHIGEREKAIKIMEEAIDLQKKLLGISHLEVAKMYLGLGQAYERFKEYDEAKKYHEKSYQIFLPVLGHEHQYTQTVIETLNYLEYLKNNSDSNQERFSEEKITEEIKIALQLKQDGEFEKARVILEKIIILLENNLGKEHPLTAEVYFYLGIIYSDLKQFKEAVNYCGKCYDIYLTYLGEQHQKTQEVSMTLGFLQMSLGTDSYNKS